MRRPGVRLIAIFTACVLALCLCACGAAVSGQPGRTPWAAGLSLEPLRASVNQDMPRRAEEAEGWQGRYLAFLDDNYDIFAALWPEGVSGIGFIDLDLDGTPEMLVFDQGASATMGVQLFDLIEGRVYCVSSVSDSAAGAFGDEYFSDVSVCASFYEAFRLTRLEDGRWCFWVMSANGALETSWDEIVRFDSVDGVLTPVSVCARYLQSDIDTGLVVDEVYTVGGEPGDMEGYQTAADVYLAGEDAGYEAQGIFMWSDMNAYEVGYEGLMAMARDAADAYAPITGTVTRPTPAG